MAKLVQQKASAAIIHKSASNPTRQHKTVISQFVKIRGHRIENVPRALECCIINSYSKKHPTK